MCVQNGDGTYQDLAYSSTQSIIFNCMFYYSTHTHVFLCSFYVLHLPLLYCFFLPVHSNGSFLFVSLNSLHFLELKVPNVCYFNSFCSKW